MTAFDKREEAFEKRFAHDEELRFKADARRDKLLAAWAAEKLGKTGQSAIDYANEVIAHDMRSADDRDLFVKIRQDFLLAGVTISDHRLRRKMDAFLAAAMRETIVSG